MADQGAHTTQADSEERIIRAALEREPEVRFALLFGSRARGQARPDSDWDMGVYLSDTLDAAGRFDRLRELAAGMPQRSRVDLVALNDAPALLGHRALQGEVLLMRDRCAFVRYFIRTLAASEDERYWRALFARERARRLEEGRYGRP